MSAYLSPIQSSGDSTPVESLISSQSCIPLVKDEMDQIENEFPVREFKQTTNKRQASKTVDTGRQKKLTTATTTTTTRTTTNKKPRLALDNNNNSTLITTTSSDEEELENSSSSADANKDQLRGHESRFLCNQQNNLSRHKIDRSQRARESSTIKSTNHKHNHKPHQCLADQFQSMISIAAKSEQNQQIYLQQQGNETRSSSCASSESDLLDGNETNNFNQHDREHKLKGLLTRAATRQQKLRKKFKQILQSIPVVQLVATTSIMTIIILVTLFLLGGSQHFVTALKSHRTSATETTTGDLDGKPHDDTNHNNHHHHHHPHHHQQQQHDSAAGLDTIQTSGGNIDQRQPSALPQMQSLVMGTRIGPPGASQWSPLAQATDSALADETLKLDETSSQQRRPIVNLRRELIGNLFAQRQHQRHHNSHHQHQQHHNQHSRQLIDSEQGRAPQKRQFETRLDSDEQLNSAGEPLQQEQQQQQQVGLFDSLGSMLFGAANQQQAQPVADELGQLAASQADIENDRATLERELSANGDQEEGLQTGGFVLDGAPHVSPVMAVSPRPAHLHSSALVLGGQNGPSQQQQQSKQHLSARQTGSHPRQQQQQHVAGANPLHHHQNEPQVDRQQQQQPAESTMASNRLERKFDVPQIQCNNTDEGFERFACPTPDNLGRYRCIEDVLVCNGYFDCPNHEDEDRISCMYYRVFKSHIDILTNTFLTWVKTHSRQEPNDITSNQNANNPHNHRQQPLHSVGGELED